MSIICRTKSTTILCEYCEGPNVFFSIACGLLNVKCLLQRIDIDIIIVFRASERLRPIASSVHIFSFKTFYSHFFLPFQLFRVA